jgi:hypothetical protein
MTGHLTAARRHLPNAADNLNRLIVRRVDSPLA